MRVLVACEESQRVCTAFRERGHEAYSCDIIECSGGHPEWHIQGDILNVLNPKYLSFPCGGDNDDMDGEYGIEFNTSDGDYHYFFRRWDLIIAHPPCTYLTVTGNRWFNVEKYGEKAILRERERTDAEKFFLEFTKADCERIAVENPVGIMSTVYRKPDQIIQPYMFGDPFEKKTCLWLKNLPNLSYTEVVEPPPRKHFESGKSMPAWYADAFRLPKEERAKLRSKTFPGIAKAMAEQWG